MFGGWLWFFAAASIIAITSGYIRRFIRHIAPFYAAWNIIVVGICVGILNGILVYVADLRLSAVKSAMLLICGLLSNLYLGYQRDTIDWAKKSLQVSVVAALAYTFVSLGLLVY